MLLFIMMKIGTYDKVTNITKNDTCMNLVSLKGIPKYTDKGCSKCKIDIVR